MNSVCLMKLRRLPVNGRRPLALTLVVLLCGCTIAGPKPTATLQQALTQEKATNEHNQTLNDQLFAAASAPVNLQSYVLREGDLLQIKVYEDQDLDTEARVSARGTVTLPLLGEVEVRGLSTADAERKIADAYRARYYQDPHVNVFVKEQQGGRITVLGAVQKPGTYEYYTPQRLLDVLAMAGGLSEQAGCTVQVRRPGTDPTQPHLFVVDIDEMVKKGHAELNLPIEGGDAIYVPLAGRIYVDGAVRNPGNYPIKQAMTVSEAIVAAGGLAPAASEDNIKLVRFIDGRREVIELNGQQAQGGKDTLEVQDRDIVFVETNKMQAFIYGLRFSVIGLGGFGYSPPPR